MFADFKRMLRQVQLDINEVATATLAATYCAQTRIQKTAAAADLRTLVDTVIREKIRAGFRETGSAGIYGTPPTSNRFGGGAEQRGHATQWTRMMRSLKLRRLLLFVYGSWWWGGRNEELKP